MTTTRNKKSKRIAAPVPQTTEEAERFLSQLGEAQRQIVSFQLEADGAIAEIHAVLTTSVAPLEAQIQLLLEGLYGFASSHRDELTKGGKTIKLIAGELSWRNTPPKVNITRTEVVLANIKKLGLAKRFIRTKLEVNKEAMLADEASRALASSIDGVSIGQREEFFAKPNETDGIAADLKSLAQAS